MKVARAKRGIDLLINNDRVEASLWRNFKQKPNGQSRSNLFEYYTVYAKRISKSIYIKRPRDNFELSDVEQLAYQGLLESIDRFDPIKNNNFKAYAAHRIKGSINNGLSKISENTAYYQYSKRSERDRLRSLTKNKKNVDSDPISELSKLTAMLAIGLMIESDADNVSGDLQDNSQSAYDSLAWSELKQAILEQVEKLPEKEAFIIRHHYQRDISFRQIGEIMSLSKGRISQLHLQALMRMRSKMAKFR